jgi:hypothetical protein
MQRAQLPRHDLRAGLTLLAWYAARARLPPLASASGLALSAQELPALGGTEAGTIALSDERGAIERNDIEMLVSLVCIECAADIWR